jgi:hypothetical protein
VVIGGYYKRELEEQREESRKEGMRELGNKVIRD